jgi:hypothetical protein
MLDIKLDISGFNDWTSQQTLLEGSVPFPKGVVFEPALLRLLCNGKILTSQFEVTARWPDRSIRWCVVSVYKPEGFALTDEIYVQAGATVQASSQAVSIEESASEFSVQQANCRHQLAKDRVSIATFRDADAQEPAWVSGFEVTTASGLLTPQVSSLECLTKQDAAFALFRYQGFFQQYPHLHFALELRFYPGNVLHCRYVLHNQGRALHPGGMWDLGDQGSIELNHVRLLVKGQAEECVLQSHPSMEFYRSEPLQLVQHSSGGANWQNQNHIDKSGIVLITTNGFTLNGEQVGDQAQLSRAEPIVYAQNNLGLVLAAPAFWQKFPNAILLSKTELTISLFEGTEGFTTELQGGEKSSRELWFAFPPKAPAHQADAAVIAINSLRWVYQPARLTVSAAYTAQTQVLPWFKREGSALLDTCILPVEHFFQKREQIDEYGWRNFGDIFADHETLYQPADETPYISHYNNQYDAIGGFCRQYLLTGDQRWFELMDDLARHVTDIDIYDTDNDRDEYNHGLFWHTDHYLPAHTSTHRTYSRCNLENGRYTAGGGPGPEHCYTTGLTLHYCLTGTEASKRAVVNLAHWMIHYHEGAEHFFARLLAVKNNELNRLLQFIRKQTTLPYAYPFTRGTGNYITALLDAFALTEDPSYLSRVEHIIRSSVHPADDIASRDLGNIEASWSYLIYLTSLVRFLDVKAGLTQFDQMFFYTRASLLHYASWIAEHEKPFLTEPAKLEFPNDTWAAQDIRKAFVLYHAGRYARNQAEYANFQHQSAAFLAQTIAHLSQSDTLHFSRIQIVLLQNYYVVNADKTEFDLPNEQQYINFGAMPTTSLVKELLNVIGQSCKALLLLRPKLEWSWLKRRFNLS